MKVLQLVTTPRPFFAQQVETLATRGVECSVLAVPGEHRASSPRSMSDYCRYYPRVLDHARSGEYDLVHANYGLVAPFALAQPVRPVVLTLWGSDLMGERAWLRWVSRAGARLADAVVVPSSAMSRALDVAHVQIPFGVDTSRFGPIPRDEARARIGWETDRAIALFAADPAREVKDYPRAKRVVDRAEVDVELRTIADVPHEAVPLYLNASDLLLVTSRRESGPMVVREAVACGRPVVATDVGFVRETLDGLSGCAVCTSDDELVAAVEAVVATGERGRRCDPGDEQRHEAVDEWSLDAMADALVALYDRLLDDDDRPLADDDHSPVVDDRSRHVVNPRRGERVD